MIQSLIDATALPNLHPAVVHFPIVCMPLALAFDAAGLALRRQHWLAPAATTLYVVGALTAGLAVWAGQRAADSLVGVPAAAQPRIGEHSDWAHYTLYAWIALAAVRLLVHLWPRLKDRRGPRLVILGLGLAVLGVLGKTADLGGALVYRFGLGVNLSTVTPEALTDSIEAPMAEEPSSTHMDRLTERADGALVWQPAADDREALGTVLHPARGSDIGAVQALEPEGDGLRLAIDKPTTLLLPGTFGDVHIEAEIELLSFQGSVGLVHHYVDEDDRGTFSISHEGEALLDDVRNGDQKVLDRKETGAPNGVLTIAVSAAGKHLKGLVDSETVTHGHIAPGPEGACGLRLNGHGTLRLLRMEVQPLQ